jgi:hypothetical protein
MTRHFLIMRRLAGFVAANKGAVCPFLSVSPDVPFTNADRRC